MVYHAALPLLGKTLEGEGGWGFVLWVVLLKCMWCCACDAIGGDAINRVSTRLMMWGNNVVFINV